MLRGRIALASVYLCFVCLLGLTPQLAAKLCIDDIFVKLETLIGKVHNLEGLNCTLYTPTTDDYLNCPKSTLKCFANEVKVLTEELEAVNVHGMYNFPLIKGLQKLAVRIKKKESDCRRCEVLIEKEAKLFLDDLKTILQMTNFKYCA